MNETVWVVTYAILPGADRACGHRSP